MRYLTNALRSLFLSGDSRRTLALRRKRRQNGLGVERLEERAMLVTVSGLDSTMFEVGIPSAFVSPASGGLSSPKDLVQGPDGLIYVASAETNSVLRFTTGGQFVSTFIAPNAGSLYEPFGLAFGPDHNLYVGSGAPGRQAILVYNGTTGLFLRTFVPAGTGGPGELSSPTGIVFGGRSDLNRYPGGWGGDLFVADKDSDSILRYTGPDPLDPWGFPGPYLGGDPNPATGQQGATFVASGSGGLDSPSNLAIGPGGSLYVSGFDSHNVLRYSSGSGAFISEVVSRDEPNLATPRGLTFDQDGRLYVADFETSAIHRYDSSGQYMDDPVAAGVSTTTLRKPFGMMTEWRGGLLISSMDTDSVVSYDRGVVITRSQAVTPFYVDYQTLSGTAVEGADYSAQMGRVQFTWGQQSRLLLLATRDNLVIEGNEFFKTELSNAWVGLLGSALINEATVPVTGATSFHVDTVALNTINPELVPIGGFFLVAGETNGGQLHRVTGQVQTGPRTTEIFFTPGLGAGTYADNGVVTFPDWAYIYVPALVVDNSTVIVPDDDINRQFTIGDASAVEGFHAPHDRGPLVQAALGAVLFGATFGPDGKWYTVSSGAIDRYDANGAFLDHFVPVGTLKGGRDIAFSNGFLYVAEEDNDDVLRFDATTGAFAGIFVSVGSGGIDGPRGLTFGPDFNGDGIQELYVSGSLRHTVVRYDGDSGQPLGIYVTAGSGGLFTPEGLAFDPGGNYLYVASLSGLQRYDAQTGAAMGALPFSAADVEFGPDGMIYVANLDSGSIQRFNLNGDFIDDYITGINGVRFVFGPDGDVYVNAGANEISRFGIELEIVSTVSISTPSSLLVTVKFATLNGTAIAGSDYTATPGTLPTLTFEPGITSKVIRVATLDDDIFEPTERFTLKLSNAAGGFIPSGGDVATMTIADDDRVALALAASPGIVGNVHLSWGTVIGDLGYVIERRGEWEPSFYVLDTASENVHVYEDMTTLLNTTYYYRLRRFSGYSNIASVTTFNPSVPPVPPTGVAATTVSANQIDLVWNEVVPNESGYLIERQNVTDGLAWTVLVTNLPPETTHFSDSTARDATTYAYRIWTLRDALPSAVPSDEASALTLPATPSAPIATVRSYRQIDLQWTDVARETGYRVERSSDTITWIPIATTAANLTTFSDKGPPGPPVVGLPASTVFHYRIRALDDAGASLASAVTRTATLAKPVAPAAPTGLRATVVSFQQISLAWTDNATNETGYAIDRKVAGGSWTPLASNLARNTIRYNDTTVAPTTTYSYRIRAIVVAPIDTDSVSSTPSNVATATTGLPAPTNLTATVATSSKIDLKWSDLAGETGYVVERSLNNTAWTKIATLAANTVSYANISLAAKTTYFYRIRSTRAAAVSAPGNVASATTFAVGTAPLAPTNLLATAAFAARVDLTWTDNSNNETGFVIDRSTNGGVTWTKIKQTAANAKSYNDTTVAAGTNYRYRLRAIGPAGYSSALTADVATPAASPLVAPKAPSSGLKTIGVSQQTLALLASDSVASSSGVSDVFATSRPAGAFDFDVALSDLGWLRTLDRRQLR